MSNIIGQSLGRYYILEQLGEGGMSVVYTVNDTRFERGAKPLVKIYPRKNCKSD